MNTILRRFTAGLLTAAMALSLGILPAQAADVEDASTVTTDSTEEPAANTDTVTDETTDEGGASVPVDVSLVTDHVRYLGGYPDGSVQPNKAVTRAEAAAILYRLLDDPESGTGTCSYTDVSDGQWYTDNVRALCRLGLFDDGDTFRPNDAITRAELVDLLVRLAPDVRAEASFSDVPADYWAADAIAKATSLGWIAGYEDGTFRPDNSLTRAEACAFINRVTNREGDAAQAKKLIGLGLFSDINEDHWAAVTIAEAAVAHTPTGTDSAETWSGIDLTSLTFTPGVHNIDGTLYSVDRNGQLAINKTVGAYQADANGVLTQTASSYQVGYVPYISQIDGIYAWVGCEPVSALMGPKPSAMRLMSVPPVFSPACRILRPIQNGALSVHHTLSIAVSAPPSIRPPSPITAIPTPMGPRSVPTSAAPLLKNCARSSSPATWSLPMKPSGGNSLATEITGSTDNCKAWSTTTTPSSSTATTRHAVIS